MKILTSILWRRLDVPGHEYLELRSQPSGWLLDGTALFEHDRQPTRLAFQVNCDERWTTVSATVKGRVGAREIDVRIARHTDGSWKLNDQPSAGVSGCVDVDLNFSPSTNLLPIRRLQLAIGQKANVRAAWLRFPSFTLEPFDQSYERLGERLFRYESAGGSFVADLEVSEAGVPQRYGNIWTADAAWESRTV